MRLNQIIDLLYPRRCPLCQEILEERTAHICKECRKKAVPLQEPLCRKCGKPLGQSEREYCQDCRNHTHFYDRGFSAFPYRGEVRESMMQFKFHNKREYGDFYAEELVRLYGEKICTWSPDCLIPIPMYPGKQRKRGYNQAQVLAKKIGERMGIPVWEKLLIRCHDTEPQKMLGQRDREKNLKNAFKIPVDDVKLKKVLLIDDIYTTGATVDAAARVLKMAGVCEVWVLTVCTGKADC